MTTESTISAIGRRKDAVARVKINSGNGKIKVNGRDFEDYFTTASLRTVAVQPLTAADLLKKFDVEVNAHGGGLMGQAGAVSLALARALIQFDQTHRSMLKKKTLLKRDPRMKERKKSGQLGARKRFQFSKR